MTILQAQWIKIAERLGLDVELGVPIPLSEGQVVAPVVLRKFGARNGMVLVAKYEEVRAHTNSLVEAGFGYSTLGEPKSDDFDVNGVIEMLRDWGWTGDGPSPTWLCEDAT
jgi:hypothetical protein